MKVIISHHLALINLVIGVMNSSKHVFNRYNMIKSHFLPFPHKKFPHDFLAFFN